MKQLLKRRTFCFFAGTISPSLAICILGLFFGPSPKNAMPFSSVLEEYRSECFLPADYSYSLKSTNNSRESFIKFVEDMNMEDHKANANEYSKYSKSQQSGTMITFDGGTIEYSEYAH